MSDTPMTLAAFRASHRFEAGADKFEDFTGMATEDFGPEFQGMDVWGDAAWGLRQPDGQTNAVIFRDERTGNLADVSAWLWFEFYVSEIVPQEDWTEKQLITLCSDWAAWQGLPHASADEMLAALPEDENRRARADWLMFFIKLWEVWEERTCAEVSA